MQDQIQDNGCAEVAANSSTEGNASVGIADLRLAASRGSVEALTSLCEIALGAGDNGQMPVDEALSAAETFAFLAAARGGDAERWSLVSVLIARAERCLTNRDCGSAFWYRQVAARQLKTLDNAGDEAAAVALLDLGCAVSEVDPEADDLAAFSESLMARAGGGDLDALGAMVDGCLLNFRQGGTLPVHALVKAEELAWIGGIAGDPVMIGKLAGVLTLRCYYEWEHGDRNRAAFFSTEAIGVALAGLSRDSSMASPLGEVINQLPEPLLVAAVTAHPQALNFCTAAGAA